MSESECHDCGESFASAHAVAVHQGQTDCGDDEPEFTEFERRVLDRDDEDCRRCEAEATVVHQIDAESESEARLPNYASLCATCRDYITGFAAVTQRTVIENGIDDDDEKPWYAQSRARRRPERRQR